MELPFAGLHQLFAPLLELLPNLPAPQADALGTVFGFREGSPPERLLVGLAALSLLCVAAERKPLAPAVSATVSLASTERVNNTMRAMRHPDFRWTIGPRRA
jgi:hypothetical protein